MSFSDAQNEAIEILVGLCTTSKEAPTITQLLRDYKELEGKHLDTTGFQSVSDMLRASDRFDLVQRGGTVIVVAKISFESLHIIEMVGKQREYNKSGARNNNVSSCFC